MDKFKEIISVEQNSFADERFSRNGGGYLQPHIVYDYQGEKVELFDKFLWTDKGVNVLETLARKKHLL